MPDAKPVGDAGGPPRTGKKGGRPRAEIDPRQVEAMAYTQATVAQMAAFFGVSQRTLMRRFRRLIKRARRAGNATVRMTAYQMATSGKHPIVTMAWLNNEENWRNPKQIEATGKDGGPLIGQQHTTYIVMLPDNGRDPDLVRQVRERQARAGLIPPQGELRELPAAIDDGPPAPAPPVTPAASAPAPPPLPPVLPAPRTLLPMPYELPRPEPRRPPLADDDWTGWTPIRS